jgi:hypothetical protein
MFLTVKEASDLTGKSATTIYRLCNKRRNSSFIKKEDNKFFIDKEFLLATYPPEEKRVSEIIEYGSKETGEPVFLEIEQKKQDEGFVTSYIPDDLDLEAGDFTETDQSDEAIPDTLSASNLHNLPDAEAAEADTLDNEAETSLESEDEDDYSIEMKHQNIDDFHISGAEAMEDADHSASLMENPAIEPEEKQKQAFYNRKEFWELSIGLTILVLALVSLVFILYQTTN